MNLFTVGRTVIEERMFAIELIIFSLIAFAVAVYFTERAQRANEIASAKLKETVAIYESNQQKIQAEVERAKLFNWETEGVL